MHESRLVTVTKKSIYLKKERVERNRVKTVKKNIGDAHTFVDKYRHS